MSLRSWWTDGRAGRRVALPLMWTGRQTAPDYNLFTTGSRGQFTTIVALDRHSADTRLDDASHVTR